MQILSNPITALNVRESPKFSRHFGNRGLGTRWWRQILETEVDIRPFHACAIHPAIIIGTVCSLWTWPMGQIPRSTERISMSTFYLFLCIYFCYY